MGDPAVVSKLSTGADSTLGNWRKLVSVFFGEGPALTFIDEKIAEQGEDEEVVIDERQLLHLLTQLQFPQS